MKAEDIFLDPRIWLVELSAGLESFFFEGVVDLLVTGKAIAVGAEGMMIVPPRAECSVIPTNAGMLMIF